jgi:hypothetical protein
MALSDIIRKGVAIADKITKPLQVSVTHYRWIGTNDETGEDLFDAGVLRKAIQEKKSKFLRRTGGQQYNTAEELIQLTVLTFIGPVEAQGLTEGRDEPIDPRDRFVCSDGTSGPIMMIEGVADPATGSPYTYEVGLGT